MEGQEKKEEEMTKGEEKGREGEKLKQGNYIILGAIKDIVLKSGLKQQ